MASATSVNSSAVQVLLWKAWQSFYHRACTQKCQSAWLSKGLGATRESTWLKCRHCRTVLVELSWKVVESSFGNVPRVNESDCRHMPWPLQEAHEGSQEHQQLLEFQEKRGTYLSLCVRLDPWRVHPGSSCFPMFAWCFYYLLMILLRL